MSSDIEQLAADIPIVDDRMLLEVVNGITIGRSMGARNNGFFGRLAERMTGRHQQGTDAALDGLAEGQQGLMAWLTELSSQTAVSNFALARALRHSRQMANALHRIEKNTGQLSEQLREVESLLARTIEHFDQRLTEVEHRLARAELNDAAMKSFMGLVSSWKSGRRYAGMPWVFQVALLSREMVSGPCGELEHRTGERTYRDLLADEIIGHKSTDAAIDSSPTVRRLVEAGIFAVPDEQRRLMLAELLDAGLNPRLALPGRPLSATITTALELSSLPTASRPAHPAAVALSLARMRLGPLEGTTDPRSFVTRLIREQADSAQEYRLVMLGGS
jgi:hypothetical protein